MTRRLRVLAATAAAVLFTSLPALAQESTTLHLGAIDASAFPQVSLTLWATGPGPQSLSGLTAGDLAVFENDQPVGELQVAEAADGAVRLIYLVDLGQYVNFKSFGYGPIRRAISYPLDSGLFVEGTDQLEILARSSDGQFDRTLSLLEPSTQALDILGFVNSFSPVPGDGPTQLLKAVEELLQQLAEAPSSEWLPTSIVVLTHTVEKPTGDAAGDEAERIGQAALEAGIPIYTLHVSTNETGAFPLQVLAHESGGEYVRLLREGDQRDAFSRIYSAMTAPRTYYTVTYRSPTGTSGDRSVVVVPAGQTPDQATAVGSYNVDLLPPTVLLTAPTEGETIQLAVEPSSDGPDVYTPATITARAVVETWPDGFPRRIARAELLGDGRVLAAVDDPPEGSEIAIEWPVSGFETFETTTLPLSVRLTDELDVSAESAPVAVDLVFDVASGFPLSCLNNPLSLGCAALCLVPLTLLAGAAVVVGLGVAVARSRGRGAALPTAPREPEHTIVASAAGGAVEKIGRLHVIVGPPEWAGKDIDLEEFVTRIGRDPGQTEITFYPRQSTTVSGLHGTLRLYSGKFYLTDNNSTNGTRVNGQLLIAEQPHELADGDQIALGDLSLQGVQLQFFRGQAARGSAGIDETHIERGAADHTVVESKDSDPPSPPKTGGSGGPDDAWIKDLG